MYFRRLYGELVASALGDDDGSDLAMGGWIVDHIDPSGGRQPQAASRPISRCLQFRTRAGTRTMNELLFNHYVSVAAVAVPGGLALLIVWMLVSPAKRRVIDCLSSIVIYLALVALGMSEDIKHLNAIGVAHAATAFGIAILAIRSYRNRASWLLAIPCLLILVVLVFNAANEGRGLELMGRWN